MISIHLSPRFLILLIRFRLKISGLKIETVIFRTKNSNKTMTKKNVQIVRLSS